jgi:transglutaminase-like putative cysteine protease
MKFQIRHTTRYKYSEPASLSQNELYLHPRDTQYQTVLGNRLVIEPKPAFTRSRSDYFGNLVDVFMVQASHRELSITAESLIGTAAPNTPAASSTPAWESVAQHLSAHPGETDLEAYQFVFPSPMISVSPALKRYGEPSFVEGAPILEAALDLTRRINEEFTYEKGATTVGTAVEALLESKKGVCQDFAHFQIGVMRAYGLAARYVSGYLETLPPPGKPKLLGADASHAWLSVFIPHSGWVDLDPTNNRIPGERHITIAWGRDYGDVTPTKGIVMGGGVHSQSILVDVLPKTDP